MRGRGRLISFDITPTTVSDFVILKDQWSTEGRSYSAEAEGFHYSAFGLSKDTRRRSSPLPFFRSPLFSICYVILISSNTWTLQDEEVKNQTFHLQTGFCRNFETKKNSIATRYANYEMLFD